MPGTPPRESSLHETRDAEEDAEEAEEWDNISPYRIFYASIEKAV
jgi:hypothetical protein